MAEITKELGQDRQTDSGTFRGSRTDKSQQENQLRQFAEQNGIRLSKDQISELVSNQLPSGKEADIYIDISGDNVIKVVNYQKYSKTPTAFFNNRVVVFNKLFPETAYNIIGFTETDKGFSFVLSQPYIAGKLLSRLAVSPESLDEQQQRIADYMKDKLGMNPAGLDAFENESYKIEDVHLKNVIQGEDGNLYFIDVIPADRQANSKAKHLLDILQEGEKANEEKKGLFQYFKGSIADWHNE